ncbi:MAG: hypothetical protein AB2814_06260 [Candidatus Sedimenticola endophacoides]
MEDNLPASVGTPLPGVEVRVDEHQELLVRGCSLMQGHWNNPGGTAQALDPQGWLHTGDQVLLEEGHLYITGRLKEIIGLANGEKVAPADMEGAVALDGLFEQVLVVGEGRSHLCALLVLDPQAAESFRQACEVAGQESPADVEAALRERVNGIERIQHRLRLEIAPRFPGVLLHLGRLRRHLLLAVLINADPLRFAAATGQ